MTSGEAMVCGGCESCRKYCRESEKAAARRRWDYVGILPTLGTSSFQNNAISVLYGDGDI